MEYWWRSLELGKMMMVCKCFAPCRNCSNEFLK
jgi:hypothetical protein